MKLSFLPGELILEKKNDGQYLVTVQGQEVLSTHSEKKAIAEYNKIRKDMEAQFPAHELSREEKTQLLLKYIAQIPRVSPIAKEKKKKYVPGSTNTFG
jgi:regulatory protein YycH of two-component signal transduction system YycFG